MIRLMTLVFLTLSIAQPVLAFDQLTIEEARAEEFNDSGRTAARNFQYKDAFGYFTRGAELGSPRALANLGLLHIRGHGVAKDRAKGLYMLKRASESGVAIILYFYGDELLSDVYRYESALIRRRERETWARAADRGDDAAAAKLKKNRAIPIPTKPSPGQAEEALAILEKAAERGNLRARMQLAQAYITGIVVESDQNRASKHLQAMVVSGSPLAKLQAAHIEVLRKAYTNALPLYSGLTKAFGGAQVEIQREAHLRLFKMHASGLGVPQDFKLAARHFLMAQFLDDGDGDARERSRGARVAVVYRLETYDKRFITELKESLRRWGYYDGPLDGSIDASFRLALNMYPYKKGHFSFGSIYEDFGERFLKSRVVSLVREDIMILRLERTLVVLHERAAAEADKAKREKLIENISTTKSHLKRTRFRREETIKKIRQRRTEIGLD